MSKFSRHEWAFTGSDENLFELGREALAWFRLLVKEARRHGFYSMGL